MGVFVAHQERNRKVMWVERFLRTVLAVSLTSLAGITVAAIVWKTSPNAMAQDTVSAQKQSQRRTKATNTRSNIDSSSVNLSQLQDEIQGNNRKIRALEQNGDYIQVMLDAELKTGVCTSESNQSDPCHEVDWTYNRPLNYAIVSGSFEEFRQLPDKGNHHWAPLYIPDPKGAISGTDWWPMTPADKEKILANRREYEIQVAAELQALRALNAMLEKDRAEVRAERADQVNQIIIRNNRGR